MRFANQNIGATAIPTVPYVGLPFLEGGRTRGGLDCWGLLRLVYDEQLLLKLPMFGELAVRPGDPASADAVQAQIEASAADWIEVSPGEEEPYDALLLPVIGRPTHVALVVLRPLMLHADFIRRQVNCVRWDGPEWSARARRRRVYRHPMLCWGAA
jgi:cell wall-associated NlpC family hydrolase